VLVIKGLAIMEYWYLTVCQFLIVANIFDLHNLRLLKNGNTFANEN